MREYSTKRDATEIRQFVELHVAVVGELWPGFGVFISGNKVLVNERLLRARPGSMVGRSALPTAANGGSECS